MLRHPAATLRSIINAELRRPGSPPLRVVGAPLTASPDVKIGGAHVLRVGDSGVLFEPTGVTHWTIANGSPTVFVNDSPIATIEASIQHPQATGRVVTGENSVRIASSPIRQTSEPVEAAATATKHKRQGLRIMQFNIREGDSTVIQNFANYAASAQSKGKALHRLAVIGAQEVEPAEGELLAEKLQKSTGLSWAVVGSPMGVNIASSGIAIAYRSGVLSLVARHTIDLGWKAELNKSGEFEYYLLRAQCALFKTRRRGRYFGCFTCKLLWNFGDKDFWFWRYPQRGDDGWVKGDDGKHDESWVRRVMARRLLRGAKRFMRSHGHPHAPRIIAMDMNTDKNGKTYRYMDRYYNESNPDGVATHDDGKQIDFLWYQGKRLPVAEVTVGPPLGSDHRYVVGKFSV